MVKILSRRAGSILDLLQIREIKRNCLISKDGSIGAIIRVTPVNFSLMSESEQEGILARFRTFILSLDVDASISIHIRILPFDIKPYLELIEAADDPVLTDIAHNHADFVNSLASKQAILKREFYIRVWLDKVVKKHVSKEEMFDIMRGRLELACNDLLTNIEAGSRLGDAELAQYYLSVIHTHYAENNPIEQLYLDKPIKGYTFNNLNRLLNGDKDNKGDSSLSSESTGVKKRNVQENAKEKIVKRHTLHLLNSS
jgi:hypothetical protein